MPSPTALVGSTSAAICTTERRRSAQRAPLSNETTYHQKHIHGEERRRRRTPRAQRHQKGNAGERVWKHRLDDERDDGEIERRMVTSELFPDPPSVLHHTVTDHARQQHVQEHGGTVICQTELGSDSSEEVAPWCTAGPVDKYSQD